VFVLDMGAPFKIVDLARRFIEMHGLAPVFPEDANAGSRPGEMPVRYTGARPGEKLYEELALDAETIRESRHPDIRIWGLAAPEPAWIQSMLEQLTPSRRSRDAAQVSTMVRQLCPERARPIAAA
jgi:FlaA1/EpsC-like NDP-sugar epimerase